MRCKILSSSIWPILCKHSFVIELVLFVYDSYPLFFSVLEKSLVFLEAIKRQPFAISMFHSFFKITLVTLIFLNIQKPFPFSYPKRKNAFVDFRFVGLYSFTMFDSFFKLANIKNVISAVQPISMRLSVFPKPIIILVSRFFLSLILRNPYHFSFARSFVFLKITHIKVSVLVDLNSHPVSHVVQHFTFVYFAF